MEPKKEPSERNRFGTARVPLILHLIEVLEALGHKKWDRDVVWSVVLMQAARDPGSFPWGTRALSTRYRRIAKMKQKSKHAFLYQVKGIWKGHRKNRITMQTPTPPPPPPPMRPTAVSAEPRHGRWPKPPVTIRGEKLQATAEKVLESKGKIPRAKKVVSVLSGFKHRATISLLTFRPEDAEEIESAVKEAIRSAAPFKAAIVRSCVVDQLDGHWLDLLIDFNLGLVDLYKLVLTCELIKDVEAKPPSDYGKVRHAKKVF